MKILFFFQIFVPGSPATESIARYIRDHCARVKNESLYRVNAPGRMAMCPCMNPKSGMLIFRASMKINNPTKSM